MVSMGLDLCLGFNSQISGGMSFVESLGRKVEVGALVRLEELMGQECGRRSERSGPQLFLTLFLFWEWNKIAFWKDTWCGEEAFCNSFSSLFALATSKEALVENVWESSREDGPLALLALSMTGK